MVRESITSPVAHHLPVGRQFLSVASPLNDDLETGIGQAVQGAVAQDGIIKESEPFLTARSLVMTKLETRWRPMISS